MITRRKSTEEISVVTQQGLSESIKRDSIRATMADSSSFGGGGGGGDKGPKKGVIDGMFQYFKCMSSTRMMVLTILCLQNSLSTVMRRYSQGVLREVYSKVNFCL